MPIQSQIPNIRRLRSLLPLQGYTLELEPGILGLGHLRIGELGLEEVVYLADEQREVRYPGNDDLYAHTSVKLVSLSQCERSFKRAGTHVIWFESA